MFQVGDTVVCGSNGVCSIECIGPLPNMGKSAIGRNYYTLKPCFDNDGRIYLPVDTDKVVIRYTMSKDEVNELVSKINTLEQITITDEKMREAEYKNAINSSDPVKLVRIIKTMHNRSKSRIENGKKNTAIDERYSKIAEQRLFEELALALDIKRDEVRDYIKANIER